MYLIALKTITNANVNFQIKVSLTNLTIQFENTNTPQVCKVPLNQSGSFIHGQKIPLWLLASANSTTVVELIVELIGELFIVELSYCNYLDFLKV